jgi:hypothetical protein
MRLAASSQIVEPKGLKVTRAGVARMSEAVAGGESAIELLHRAATMVPTESLHAGRYVRGDRGSHGCAISQQRWERLPPR